MDQRGTNRPEPAETTPLWLSHHWPEHHDRCIIVAGRALCRRCLVLYPAVLVAAAAIWALDPPAAVLVAAMWVLPAPMAIEWVLEHTGTLGHHPRRMVALTLLAASALGAAFRLHVDHPFTPLAWAPIAFWVVVCGTSSVLATLWQIDEPEDWAARHEAAEEERLRRLVRQADLVERIPSPDSHRNADPSLHGPEEGRWTSSTARTAPVAEAASLRSSQLR